jgi:hypothetical protein
MPGPDLDMVGQAEQSAGRVKKVLGTPTGKVATRCPNVDVEDGVAAEHVVCLCGKGC